MILIGSRALGAALVLFACQTLAGADDREFPPTTAKVRLTVTVGDTVTIGGPGSANFLADTGMDVYVVPHQTWWEGDDLITNAVKIGRVKSDAKGQLPLTQLWKADKPGRYDIIVDYDGNGKFSYSLDAIHAVEVRPAK